MRHREYVCVSMAWLIATIGSGLFAASGAFGQGTGPLSSSPEELRGEWVFDRAYQSDGDNGIGRVWESTLSIAKDSISLSHYLPILLTVQCSFDPARNPKELDCNVAAVARKLLGLADGPLRGIYKFDGRTLTICLAIRPDVPRPTEFKAGAGLNRILMALKRKKAGTGEAVIQVVDASGKAVPGAIVAPFAWRNDWKDDLWNYERSGKTGPDGVAKRKENGGISVYVRAPERKLVGLASVSPAALQDPITVTLSDECPVSGSMTCPELSKIGKDLGRTLVELNWDGDRTAVYFSARQRFEFLVPPGRYELILRGEYGQEVHRPVEVKPGQTELALDPVALRATRFALLTGKPAPELAGVHAWKNSPAIKLADLKGKVVYLDFWGVWCGNCLVQMPKIVAFSERYKSQGVVVIGVHVDPYGEVDTPEKLDERLAKLPKDLWSVKEIPFPIALTSGHRKSQSDGKSQRGPAYDYDVTSFPEGILIDRQGRVAGYFDPADKPSIEELERLLKQ